MKVIENTPDRLVVRRVPWFFGCGLIAMILIFASVAWQTAAAGNWQDAAIWGFVAIGMPGLAFALMVRRDELILDRAQGTMTFRHTTVFSHETDQRPLAPLEMASTQTSYQNQGHKTHRVALILAGTPPKEVLTITPVYVGGSGAKQAADAINLWLKADGAS